MENTFPLDKADQLAGGRHRNILPLRERMRGRAHDRLCLILLFDADANIHLQKQTKEEIQRKLSPTTESEDPNANAVRSPAADPNGTTIRHFTTNSSQPNTYRLACLVPPSLAPYSYCARDLFLRLRQITLEERHVTSQTQEGLCESTDMHIQSRLLPSSSSSPPS